MRLNRYNALAASFAVATAAGGASAAPLFASNPPNQVTLEQTIFNSDGTFATPIQVFDGSSAPLDRQAGNSDGSLRASADTGILRAKANVTGPGPATQSLDAHAGADFTDSFIINSRSSGIVHVTIPFLVDGSIPIAHAGPFGQGTATFAVGVNVEAATGSQPGGSAGITEFNNNVFEDTFSVPCSDSGSGTDICLYSNNYHYTSPNSFDGTIDIGFDIALNTSFYMDMSLGATAESFLPGGLPGSVNFFDTAVFGGFVLPDGDTVTSGLTGPLTERDGAYNYPSVLAYLDTRTAVPEPGSLSLLSISLLGVVIGRRRRAVRQAAASS